MSESIDHKKFSSYQSPLGWSMVWNHNNTEPQQNGTNENSGINNSTSEAYTSDTTSDSFIQYASTSRNQLNVNKDEWINPAQFVPSTAFPYFNGSTSYTPNRDMLMKQHNDDSYSNCLLNSSTSLDELVTDTYNKMFGLPPPLSSPMPENNRGASTLNSEKPKKRFRTAYTTNQINAMEEVFTSKAYLSKEEREILCKKINVSEKAIKVWFQNRRMKEKRGEDTQTYSILPHIIDDIEAALNKCEVDRDLVCVPSNLVDRIGQLIHEYLSIDVNILVSLNNPNNVIIDKSDKTSIQVIEYDDESRSDDSIVELDEWKPKDEAEIKALFDLHFC